MPPLTRKHRFRQAWMRRDLQPRDPRKRSHIAVAAARSEIAAIHDIQNRFRPLKMLNGRECQKRAHFWACPRLATLTLRGCLGNKERYEILILYSPVLPFALAAAMHPLAQKIKLV